MEREIAVEQEMQLVVFRLASEEFAFEITQVREIIKPPSITVLPNVSEFIEGVTNIRGEIIHIISLRKRFGVPETERTAETRVIIVEFDQTSVGFVVDAVTEVMRIPASAVKPPPRTIAGLHSEFLKGVAQVEDRLIILLEVGKILTSDEQIELRNLESITNETPETREDQ
ncbi:MAG: purine-binding chemotaxis protein CheW [Firmicutes bacterium]|jgi:purine-binding chemotaxis protein CheW|nr:chemotaxis protein CheW [Bacillota bacterium]NLL87415.1 purine-binding chemotaxis protein CheW [Bacillota bacterium]